MQPKTKLNYLNGFNSNCVIVKREREIRHMLQPDSGR